MHCSRWFASPHRPCTFVWRVGDSIGLSSPGHNLLALVWQSTSVHRQVVNEMQARSAATHFRMLDAWTMFLRPTTRAETTCVNLRTRQRYPTLLTTMQTFLPVCDRHLPSVPIPSTSFRTHFQYEHFLLLAFYLIVCFLTSLSCMLLTKHRINTSKSLQGLFSLDLSDRISCNTLLHVAYQFGLSMIFKLNHLLIKKKEGVT